MTDERSLSTLQDRAAVIDVVLGFARALDVKDWAACRRCFAAEIETDYSDLRGEPALVRGASGWKISKVKQTVYWNTGNPDIHAGARR